MRIRKEIAIVYSNRMDYFFFAFGGGVSSNVSLATRMSSSGISSQLALAGAVFLLPGYALVVVSSKRFTVSGKVLKKS